MHVLAVSDQWWQPSALEFLLQKGADPELTTKNGKTVLQVAIKGSLDRWDHPGSWRKQAIMNLLKHGAKVNFADAEGRTPLTEAFAEGPDMVKTLLLLGADVNFGPQPPIIGAIGSFDIEVVQTLLNAGADINVLGKSRYDRDPDEPLLLYTAYAAAGGNHGWQGGREEGKRRVTTMVKLLLKHGAKANIASQDGNPLLISVVKKCGVLEPFLSLGLDLEQRDSNGQTALLAAFQNRGESQILQLVEAGGEVSAMDNAKMTALHYISRGLNSYENPTKALEILLGRGVDVDARDQEALTPLHHAIASGRGGNPNMIGKLLDAGADPRIPYPNDQGTTALHILVPCMAQGPWWYNRLPYIPIVQRLLDAGLDREARDSGGNTPIFGYIATQPEYEDDHYQSNIYPDLDEIRRILGDYDLRARNNNGETLLHVAAKRSRFVEGLSDVPHPRDDSRDMFKILLDFGLDPKVEDNLQRTPLDTAAACGNKGILDLFAADE